MKSYRWRDEDTVSGICERLGLDARAVRAANPGVRFDSLAPGDIIMLPAPCAACRCQCFHAVARGQSICSIARKFGVSALALMGANPYLDPYDMVEGEVLVVPEREYCRARYGDEPTSIALRYSLPVWRLAALNPRKIRPGMRVRLK